MIVLSENSIYYPISMDLVQLCIIFYANAIECAEKEKSYFARPQKKQFIFYSHKIRVERKDKDRIVQNDYYNNGITHTTRFFFIMNTP